MKDYFVGVTSCDERYWTPQVYVRQGKPQTVALILSMSPPRSEGKNFPVDQKRYVEVSCGIKACAHSCRRSNAKITIATNTGTNADCTISRAGQPMESMSPPRPGPTIDPNRPSADEQPTPVVRRSLG